MPNRTIQSSTHNTKYSFFQNTVHNQQQNTGQKTQDTPENTQYDAKRNPLGKRQHPECNIQDTLQYTNTKEKKTHDYGLLQGGTVKDASRAAMMMGSSRASGGRAPLWQRGLQAPPLQHAEGILRGDAVMGLSWTLYLRVPWHAALKASSGVLC